MNMKERIHYLINKYEQPAWKQTFIDDFDPQRNFGMV